MSEGFKVTTNDRVFNDDGVQIAEFDVLIQGKIGTSDFQWLIECRDRPASGAAPTAWIEQLVGRRTRFNLNKVTAVSTTGFSAGTPEFAQAQGIELREVRALTPEHFADWLELRYITNT
ncbi:MAG: restriction endonuclease, partial [Nitrospiraceae bacterium]